MASMPHRTTWFLILPALFAACVLGCVKRKETITVAKDGSVTVDLEYIADSREELHKSAIPSEDDGWNVLEFTGSARTKTTVEYNADGLRGDESFPIAEKGEKGPQKKVVEEKKSGDKHVLTAKKTFPPSAPLPGSFARQSDDDADPHLRFPTTLTLEDRPDGTYYHFRRTYPVRRYWAHLNARRENILKPITNRFDGKPVEERSRADRVEMVKGLTLFETFKMIAFAQAAFRDVWPEMPQDKWLTLRAALWDMMADLDYDHVASLFEREEGEERNRAFETEAKAFETKAMERMTSTLAETCGFGKRPIADFVDRYRWYERYHKISEDLDDDSFEITVKMPGEIVAANAHHLDGNEAKWEFDGKAIRNSEPDGVELMVTSRVVK